MWTGQRIEKFYDILVKDVLANGDIEELDTKENRQTGLRMTQKDHTERSLTEY